MHDVHASHVLNIYIVCVCMSVISVIKLKNFLFLIFLNFLSGCRGKVILCQPFCLCCHGNTKHHVCLCFHKDAIEGVVMHDGCSIVQHQNRFVAAK